MSAEALLRDLTTLGVRLTVDGDGLHVDAPHGVLTADLRDALVRHKPELLAHLRETAAQERGSQVGPPPAEVARVLGLRLDRLDRMVEVRMASCPVPLWFVPDEPAADALRAEGVPRGRIWTVHELLALLRIPDLTQAGTRTLALAKLEIDGVLDDVRPADPDTSTPNDGPAQPAPSAGAAVLPRVQPRRRSPTRLPNRSDGHVDIRRY